MRIIYLLTLYFLVFLFSPNYGSAQSVCQTGPAFSKTTALIPSIGLFSYTNGVLALLPVGKKVAITLATFYEYPPEDNIQAMNGKVYFAVKTSGQYSIWVSDGTVANTKIAFTPPNFYSRIQVLYDRLYYQSSTYQDSFLYVSDGTSPGTIIASINTLFNKSIANYGDSFFLATATFYKNEYYFTGYGASNLVLMRIPASKTDTVKIVSVNGAALSSYQIYNDKMYFRNGTFQIWESDGTASGTKLFFNLYNYNVYPPFVHKDKMYFSACDLEGNCKTYVSDGTIENTVVALNNVSNIIKGISAGKYFYFSGKIANFNYELWKSDGTQAGTELVKDIWPGVGSGYSDDYTSNIIAKDSVVYFTAGSASGLYDVWRSDGTANGTYKYIDLSPSSGYLAATNYFIFENAIYFNSENRLRTFLLGELSQNTIKSGQWNDASIWSGCRVPNQYDVVHINHSIIIPPSYKAYNLKLNISQNGKLQFGPQSQNNLGL